MFSVLLVESSRLRSFCRRLSWVAVLMAMCGMGAHLALAADPAAYSLGANEFRTGWRFTKGDQPGAEATEFDDSEWSAVRIPHDWAITGPFNPNERGDTGKLPWKGVGWYRKEFKLDRPAGSRVYLDFDGVMAFPKVYVNGKLAGEWDYGYTSFRIDATPFVNLHGDNVVAVRVDTTKHFSRWYPGAGIYRKVTLDIRNPVHIAQWGVQLSTPKIAADQATVAILATIDNHDAAAVDGAVAFTVLDPDGKEVAGGTVEQSLAPGSTHIARELSVPNPKLWDVDAPQLYTLRAEVRAAGQLVDQSVTTFGIRTVEFTADDGLHLNGRRVQIHGVNLHHDQGPLGAAFNTRAMQRQLEVMREIGVNALRTSHNAPAPEVLDLCDRMGILVWDECFDKWNATADRVNDQPSHEDHARRHFGSLVRRDRNHPSVIVWSIGNEIAADREGVNPERVTMMAKVMREFDKTRPVTLGCHSPPEVALGMYEGLDLTGWNYTRRYAAYHERYPDRPILYSESASALSTRGFYELPLPTQKTDYSAQHQVDSYDFNAAAWSDITDSEFALMARDKFVGGEFVWTGFDYLGEPTPFAQEAKSSYFGIVDLCGIPKDRYWLYRSYWRKDVETVHLLPHWNWPDRVGQPVPVFVYTSGDSAELLLNGKSLGRRTKGELPKGAENPYYEVTYNYRLRWNDVTYEPGELKAVAYRDGKEIGAAVVRTAGEPAALRLTPDRAKLAATGDDLCYVLVEALDEQGNECPLADNAVRFDVTGPGEIAGVGNGNPLSLEPFQADNVKLFYGKAILIIRTRDGEAGDIRIAASADGLRTQEASVHSAGP